MSDFIEELNAELDRRIAVMEDPKYENVPPFETCHTVASVIIFAAALLFLIVTYFNV